MKKFLILFAAISISLIAQPKESLNSSEIKLALKKLNTVGSVLYIAAHPDDENTEFLTYCNYGKLLRTGYLSLTRGDGGQNLIGDEQGDLLGVLRTQELLQARGIDGAEQFFTRAIDFGYSKTPEETFNKWGKEEILSDVVWVIRKFRPDVIVTRFPVTGEGRHGHHTASAILALEAFRIANDPDVFPEQLKYVQPWQPKRIFWNAWTPALKSMGVDSDTLIKINLGDYSRLLGRSYSEISAESRTMHKSQGFGDSGLRENYYNYFLQLDGEFAENDIFKGVDLTWNRVKGGETVSKLLNKAEQSFDYENPESVIPLLLDAYKEIHKLDDDYWISVKSKELINIIKSCAGIWIEAVTSDYYLTAGSEYLIQTGIVNRSDFPIILKNIAVDYQLKDSSLNSILKKGEMVTIQKKCIVPENINFTHPYWLNGKREKEIYDVTDIKLIGSPKNKPLMSAVFTLDYQGVEIQFTEPVYYRRNDPVKGEVYRSIELIPNVVINFNKDLYIANEKESNRVNITLKSLKDNARGKIKLLAENGWTVKPDFFDFNFSSKNEEQKFEFNLTTGNESAFSELKAEVLMEDRILNRSLVTIDYPHIQPQTLMSVARAKIIRLDMSGKSGMRIGYIKGSGDKLPEILSDLGFETTILNDESFAPGSLQNFDAIITGIRAFNTNERLKINFKSLLDYVQSGGTMIVQYNTLGDLPPDIGPYKIVISRSRVTEENSQVKFLNDNHPLLNYPNKITEADFLGWIQERGLYFPGEWAAEYEPLLEMHDTGEQPLQSALLFSRYGKGTFIYTSLSFFRQLPAGIIGAYNLFTNLIYAGKLVP